MILYWLARIKIREQFILTRTFTKFRENVKKNNLSQLMRIKWIFKIILMNETHIWLMIHVFEYPSSYLTLFKTLNFPSCLFTSVRSLYWSENSTITFPFYYRRGPWTPKNWLRWRIRGRFRNFRGPQCFPWLRRSFNSRRHKPHVHGETETEAKPTESLEPGRN